jgi:hypothetical protein
MMDAPPSVIFRRVGVARRGGERKETGARSGTQDVFISHASQDAAVANTVVDALERNGLACWIAPRQVVPGTFYADEIVHAIDAAKALVVILSNHAVGPSQWGLR